MNEKGLRIGAFPGIEPLCTMARASAGELLQHSRPSAVEQWFACSLN